MSMHLLRTYSVSVGWEFGCWDAFLSLLKNICFFMYLLCTVCLNCSMLDWLPRPGTEPWPLHWEGAALATGPPGKSWILISQLLWFPSLPPCTALSLLRRSSFISTCWAPGGRGCTVPESPSTSKAHSVFPDTSLSAFSFPTSTPCGSAGPALQAPPHCPPLTSVPCRCLCSPLPTLSHICCPLTLPVSRGSSFRMRIQVPAGSSVFLLRIQCSFWRWR